MYKVQGYKLTRFENVLAWPYDHVMKTGHILEDNLHKKFGLTPPKHDKIFIWWMVDNYVYYINI